MTDDQPETNGSTGQRAFLRRVLGQAAGGLGVELDGDVIFGWWDRTIGSAAIGGDGTRLWLRATAEHSDWARGEVWTGNVDAAAITGVPKPELVERVEWTEEPVVIYAELFSYIPDQPCSPTPELTTQLDLSDAWWSELRTAVDELATQSTSRGEHDPQTYLRELEDLYERPLGVPAPELRTEHTDLHWANLTQPRLWLLDWEYWGSAPAGYGPALLYCHSLLVPATAARVHDVFADVLDTPTGQLAQLAAAAHILNRAHRMDDYPALRDPVGQLTQRILTTLEKR
ncbi:hypothetical protein ACFTSF_09995 [Kribbella sp. NPDC056951]|uniref:hypothetical protein n=1 Tax=Kribbella sp. NPDC056951 TaxID=3345978 RepID=UPI00363DAEF0